MHEAAGRTEYGANGIALTEDSTHTSATSHTHGLLGEPRTNHPLDATYDRAADAKRCRLSDVPSGSLLNGWRGRPVQILLRSRHPLGRFLAHEWFE
jgi:hypothetical protein